MKIIVIFSRSGMFRNVPACSGMFHVPDFIDARFLSLHCLSQCPMKLCQVASYYQVSIIIFWIWMKWSQYNQIEVEQLM